MRAKHPAATRPMRGRGSESVGCGAGLLSELRLQASSAAGTLIDDRTSQESLQARVSLTT